MFMFLQAVVLVIMSIELNQRLANDERYKFVMGLSGVFIALTITLWVYNAT